MMDNNKDERRDKLEAQYKALLTIQEKLRKKTEQVDYIVHFGADMEHVNIQR